MKDLYRGSLVRLTNESPEVLAKAFAKWNQDTEQHRLAGEGPVQLWSEKKLKAYIEKHAENNPQSFRFSIRALQDDKLIGGVGLWIGSWTHSEAWMAIAIGDRDYWSKGYGTEAVVLILQYGFLELNLRRISLGLHAYNERALKSYEKCGFVMEGRMRGEGWRNGVHYDSLWMGILREEWFAQTGART